MMASGSALAMRSDAHRAFLKEVQRGTALLTVACCAAAHAFSGFGPVFYGIIVGAALAVANLWVIAFLAQRTMEGERRSRLFYSLLSGGKMLALLAVIWTTLYLLPVSPIGFVIGMTNLFAAIVVTGLLRTRAGAETTVGGHVTEERSA